MRHIDLVSPGPKHIRNDKCKANLVFDQEYARAHLIVSDTRGKSHSEQSRHVPTSFS